LGMTHGEAWSATHRGQKLEGPVADVPAATELLQIYWEAGETDSKGLRRVADWIPSDPFLGPIYRSRCCKNPACGILPAKAHEQFLFCSLCKDPAAGRFCCKDPCFAAFWKGGHNRECAGRHKLKEAKKAEAAAAAAQQG
jgi:hypothetical protein